MPQFHYFIIQTAMLHVSVGRLDITSGQFLFSPYIHVDDDCFLHFQHTHTHTSSSSMHTGNKLRTQSIWIDLNGKGIPLSLKNFFTKLLKNLYFEPKHKIQFIEQTMRCKLQPLTRSTSFVRQHDCKKKVIQCAYAYRTKLSTLFLIPWVSLESWERKKTHKHHYCFCNYTKSIAVI